MKNKLLKAICALLAVTFCISAVGCDGCGCGGDNGGKSADFTISELGPYDGLHIYNKDKISDKWIVKNGTTEYTLVVADSRAVPANAVGRQYIVKRMSLVKTDFRDLFQEATGVRIPVKMETEVSSADNGKYIFVGCSGKEIAAELTLDMGLPEGKTINNEGFRILTKDDDIYVMAKNEKGALWGTYELLAQLFNYERYWVDYYEIDNVNEVPLYNFNIADNPDFETRIGTWGAVYNVSEITNASRMRFDLQHNDVYVGAKAFHNTLDRLPPETYMAEHSAWYAQQVTADPKEGVNVFQLCYTAHGNMDEYNAMVNAMAEACEAELALDDTRPVITITQEDNRNFCTCDACLAGNAKYDGKISGNMWKFHLDVVEKINAWLDENQPGRKDNLLIAMFAYHNYQEAPSYQDANGTWHAYDGMDSMNGTRDVKNAAILSATSSIDLIKGINRDDFTKKVMESWKPCTNNRGVWMYQTNYQDYLIPTESFNYQQNYRFCLNCGAKWIFDQGQQGNKNSSGFNDFKMYLNSKLQWNVNLDVTELENKYFKAMYGPASEIMKDYLQAIRLHMQTLPPSDIEVDMTTANNFTYPVVSEWLNYAEKAYEKIAEIKDSNPDYYAQCYDHICTESITARYLLIRFYSGTISSQKLTQEKSSFKTDVLRLNFTERAQHIAISDLVSEW